MLSPGSPRPSNSFMERQRSKLGDVKGSRFGEGSRQHFTDEEIWPAASHSRMSEHAPSSSAQRRAEVRIEVNSKTEASAETAAESQRRGDGFQGGSEGRGSDVLHCGSGGESGSGRGCGGDAQAAAGSDAGKTHLLEMARDASEALRGEIKQIVDNAGRAAVEAPKFVEQQLLAAPKFVEQQLLAPLEGQDLRGSQEAESDTIKLIATLSVRRPFH